MSLAGISGATASLGVVRVWHVEQKETLQGWGWEVSKTENGAQGKLATGKKLKWENMILKAWPGKTETKGGFLLWDVGIETQGQKKSY